MATAYGEEAGDSTSGTPAGTPLTPTTAEQLEPWSPVETNRLWPWAAARWSTGFRPAVKPLAIARSSHSPAENDGCRDVWSVTHREMVGRMSVLARDVAVYETSCDAPGAKAVE